MQRFIADHTLLGLSRWLRAAGCDVAEVDAPVSLAEASRLATSQRRMLLTRRRASSDSSKYFTLAAARTIEQLAEVFAHFGPPDPERFLTRCTRCNETLLQCNLENTRDRLPATVRAWCTQVWCCRGCSRLYWRGTHAESMTERLRRAMQLAAGWKSSVVMAPRSSEPPEPVEAPRELTQRGWDEFDAFLRRIFETYHFSWRGFRRKRRGLRAHFLRRLGELQLRSLIDYESYLRTHVQEQRRLHTILSITVSRFFRDRTEWLRLQKEFPRILESAGISAVSGPIRAWSVACAGGEEPYTLSILWQTWCEERQVKPPLEILATDILPVCLERAATAVYPESSLHSVPEPFQERFFTRRLDGSRELVPRIRAGVEFRQLDLLSDPWPFRAQKELHMILCRNYAFTYLDEPRRTAFGRKLVALLRPGGLLMVGSNDRLGSETGFDGSVLGLQHLGGSLWRNPTA